MVEIGGRPILWHIMSIYAAQGFREFVVALGYKGEMIKDYFLDYHLRACSLTVELQLGPGDGAWSRTTRTGSSTCSTPGARRRPAAASSAWPSSSATSPSCSPTATASRDVDLEALLAFHRGARQAGDGHGRAAAGALRRHRLRRRPRSTASPRSRRSAKAGSTAASSCSQPGVVDYIADDQTLWEKEPLERLAARGPARSPTVTRRSGSAWTRCATSAIWKRCGPAAQAPWKVW